MIRRYQLWNESEFPSPNLSTMGVGGVKACSSPVKWAWLRGDRDRQVCQHFVLAHLIVSSSPFG